MYNVWLAPMRCQRVAKCDFKWSQSGAQLSHWSRLSVPSNIVILSVSYVPGQGARLLYPLPGWSDLPGSVDFVQQCQTLGLQSRRCPAQTGDRALRVLQVCLRPHQPCPQQTQQQPGEPTCLLSYTWQYWAMSHWWVVADPFWILARDVY